MPAPREQPPRNRRRPDTMPGTWLWLVVLLILSVFLLMIPYNLGSPGETKEPATVYVHFQSPADSPLADDVSTVLSQRGFRVAKPQFVPPRQATTNGDVRFLSPDRGTALNIGEIVQDTLADKGFRLQIRPIPLATASTPGAKAGRIEVWLPSLSGPVKQQ